jgi:hypothetical protein
MSDITVKTDDLSMDARHTIRVIDMYLDAMLPREIRITELAVFRNHWMTLDSSIKYHGREDNESLETHTYRGVRIIPQDE